MQASIRNLILTVGHVQLIVIFAISSAKTCCIISALNFALPRISFKLCWNVSFNAVMVCTCNFAIDGYHILFCLIFDRPNYVLSF